ncbi:MAG: dolichyl-phosphate-mannose-protein mannosyltransferase [Firmicutes bacterium]|nr:dolichyl-phosphate-mannose-protein mannosyltransferase [Bacillota bacterium]
MHAKSPSFIILLIIIASTLLRITLAESIGLGVDESYVVAIARNLSLSYFDHPPLHFWIIWLTAHLTGSENALVLRLPFIILFTGTTWMMYRLGSKLFGEWAGVYSALLLNVSAVFSLSTGSWLLPDGPLMFLMLAAVLVLTEIFFESESTWRHWFAVALLVGFGMLAKYHAIFLALGSLLFLLTSKAHRRLLYTAKPYFAAGTAAIVFLPVILWNKEHHWISFLFHSARGTAKGFFPLKMLANIAGQALWILPWIWLPLISILLKRSFDGPGNPTSLQNRRWFLCCLAVGPIALFTAATLWGAQGLFHWQAPGYLVAIPLLGQAVAGWTQQGSRITQIWLTGTVSIFLVLATVLGIHTSTGWLRQIQPQWFVSGDPTTEALNWSNLPPYLKEHGLFDSSAKFVVAAHWIDAGKIDYVLEGKFPVLCLNNEPHHFAFLHKPNDFKGKDALIIGRKDVIEKALSLYQPRFASIKFIGTLPITRAGVPEFDLAVYYAHDFSGTFPMPYE